MRSVGEGAGDGAAIVLPYLVPFLPNLSLLEVGGNRLIVQDEDILDGTPLLDIKPYVSQFDCFETGRSGWVGEADSKKALADNRFERKTRGRP